MSFSSAQIESQKNILKELIKGILDGLEMEKYELKIDLTPALCTVIVRLSEKNSVTFLRVATKEIRQFFKSYDHLFVKYEYAGKMVYKVAADGSEDIAEEWNTGV